MGALICSPSLPPKTVEQGREYMQGNVPSFTTVVPVNNIPRMIQKPIVEKVDEKAQTKKSEDIDKTLKKEKTEDISGADAGKSTILKQMRILHMNGFDPMEMRMFQKLMRNNLFKMFRIIANGVEESGFSINEEEKVIIDRFSDDLTWIEELNPDEELETLNGFLLLECVKSFMEPFPNYATLPDNAHYYIPNLPRLLNVEYEPTAEDVLHLRVPTTNINEINFNFSTCTIKLVDVGGQRTYRKKWIHCFENVAAILFVASMAAYDQVMDEDDMTANGAKPVLYDDVIKAEPTKQLKPDNRLRDSAHLFGEMLRNKILTSAAFILFLNKKDLFEKKLPISPLGNYIHGYKGADYDEASEFLKQYFLKRKSSKDRDRKIYCHYTCATDTQNVQFVFKAACDIVLQKNLNSSGIQ